MVTGIDTDHAANIAIWVAVAIVIIIILWILDCVFSWVGRVWWCITIPCRC